MGHLGRKSDDNCQKIAVARKSNRLFLWSWDKDKEARILENGALIGEERERKQKNDKKHFIRFGPSKRPRVNSREFL